MAKNPVRDVDSVFYENDFSDEQTVTILIILLGWMAAPILGALAAVVVVALAAGAYRFTRNVIWTAPLRVRNHTIDHIRFYEHSGIMYIARDFLASTYIFLPRQWRTDKGEDPETFECRVLHEIGHCRKLDLSKVTLWYLIRLPISVLLIGISGFLLYSATNNFEAAEIGFVVFLSAFMLGQIYVILQIPNLILKVEHKADSFALDRLGQRYVDFLRDRDFFQGNDREKRSPITKLLHPSWKRRIQFAEHGSVITSPKAFVEGFAAATFIAFPPLMLLLMDRVYEAAIARDSLIYALLLIYMTTFFVRAKIEFLFDAAMHFGEVTRLFLLGAFLPFCAVILLIISELGFNSYGARIIVAAIVTAAFVSCFIVFVRVTAQLRQSSNFALTDGSAKSVATGIFLFLMVGLLPSVFANIFVIVYAAWKIISGVFDFLMMAGFAGAAEQADERIPLFASFKRLAKVHPESLDAQNMFFGEGQGFSEVGGKIRNYCHRLLLRMHGVRHEITQPADIRLEVNPARQHETIDTGSTDKAAKRVAAPNTDGVLFSPDELDIYCNKSIGACYIFHGKIIDHCAIDYLEYHVGEHWVVVVLKDKRRLDLGVIIQWLLRPQWRDANAISIVRTHDGESKEGAIFPLRRFDAEGRWINEHQVREERILSPEEQQAFSGRMPRTEGVFFDPSEFDIYVNKIVGQCYIFHGKQIDYDDVSHFEYHKDEHWVVVELRGGTRLYLGVHIQWLLRPFWNVASELNVCRTQDGRTIDSRIYPLRQVSYRCFV